MERTKLVGTMGPVSESKEVLRQVIEAGLNVVRMNFSHGDHEEHLGRLTKVKELNKELGTNVAIMLDTRGPEMRTNEFENGAVVIEEGSEVELVFEEVLGTAKKFSINYPGLYDDVEVGTTILVDDGYLQTTVIKKDNATRTLTVKALNTHRIKNRRGVNVPNTLINMPFLSQKDIDDIVFGAKNDVDFIAASFVQTKENVEEIKALLAKHNASHIQVVAKIENQAGVDNIDEILEVVDGIMYARGDLGVEILPEDLPHIQKDIVEKTRAAGKYVIVATQMVESMQNNPVPTRAEVSDVANAVYDGADSVMLSGEMAAGKYPVEAVKMMKRIVKATEKHVDYQDYLFPTYSGNEDLDNLGFAAKVSASLYDVKAIVTDSYELTKQIAKYRPEAVVIPHLEAGDARKAYALFNVYPVVGNLDKLDLTKANLEKEDKYLVVTNEGLKIQTV